MSDASGHEQLIAELCAELRPVRPLAPPWVRAMGWIAAVFGLGLALASIADMGAVWRRLLMAPDMWLAELGCALCAVLAAVAAFATSVPDRSPRWALLPVPAALLWIAASGAGCLRGWILPRAHTALTAAIMGEMRLCLAFIVGISLPLSVLLVVMLRRACPLRPGLTAALGGLAAAAAAATLLSMFHPYDVTASDLVVHAVAVLTVVGANRVISGAALAETVPSAP
jgi:hypothetical protein